MFYIFGLCLNLFLLLLLVSKKSKSFADKVLTAWLFVIGCHLSLYVLSFQPITIDNVHQIGLSIPFPFLHGPFLYLYTASLTNQFPKRKWLWLHFLPAALIVLLSMPFFMGSAEYKIGVFNNKGKDYVMFLKIAAWFMRLSGVLYVAWSFILLRKHKKNIGELFSYEEKINLNWLRYLIYAMLTVWVIIIFIQKDPYIFGAVVICVFFLGFFGIRQVGIFGPKEMPLTQILTSSDMLSDEKQTLATDKEEIIEAASEQLGIVSGNKKLEEIPIEESPVAKQKYNSSGLSERMATEIHDRLVKLMTTENIFTEPELSLTMLAGKLNVHPNYLSQVINEKEGKKFFDYINNLRVEEFKRHVALPENSHFTIMSLAYDCGFNSKSSFYKNFKKVTGQSPSEYLTGLVDEQ